MRPLTGTIILSTLLLAGFAETGIAQEEGEPRRAQPRERAPRSEPARQAPPERHAPPARQDGGVRSRGTDDMGRARAPRDQGTREDRADYGIARRAPRDRDSNGASDGPTVTRTAPDAGAATSNVAPASPAVAASGSSEGDQDRRRAVPRGSRPRGDNPAVGRAEPRAGGSYPRDGRARDGRGYPGGYYGGSRVYTSHGRVYNNYYYYYPRRWYPYGYGAFGGLGYFYYDPYTWYSYDPYWSRPHHYHYYSSSGYGDSYYATGELRLQVHPRHAEVYVDGYFAGHVDDFDGMFQGLRLEEGPYTIEIVAPGYDTLVFDVRIVPGRKTTYRGELRPRP